MESTRARIVSVWGGIAAALLFCPPAHGTGCTETPPYVCTTTSETFFYGITHGQPLRIIDFETLPNGEPSVGGEELTPSFNYSPLGVTYSAPVGLVRIGGSLPGQHDLSASAAAPPAHTWLRADFGHPSNSVGIWFPGTTTLSAFDLYGSLIASQQYGASGGSWFLGIYSEIPISHITVDRGGSSERINDFIFSLVPEPTSALLLLSAAIMSPRHRPRY